MRLKKHPISPLGPGRRGGRLGIQGKIFVRHECKMPLKKKPEKQEE